MEQLTELVGQLLRSNAEDKAAAADRQNELVAQFLAARAPDAAAAWEEKVSKLKFYAFLLLFCLTIYCHNLILNSVSGRVYNHTFLSKLYVEHHDIISGASPTYSGIGHLRWYGQDDQCIKGKSQ